MTSSESSVGFKLGAYTATGWMVAYDEDVGYRRRGRSNAPK
jgi:hypothetical protein